MMVKVFTFLPESDVHMPAELEVLLNRIEGEGFAVINVTSIPDKRSLLIVCRVPKVGA